jgi:hypothetical protein
MPTPAGSKYRLQEDRLQPCYRRLVRIAVSSLKGRTNMAVVGSHLHTAPVQRITISYYEPR